MPRRKSPQPQLLLTVNKAISVLKLLARHGREMGVTEIAAALGMNASVASRLATTLEAEGLLRQNPQTLRYHLGFGLLELSTAALDGMELRTLAQPVLEGLNAATGETVFLMVLDRGEGVYVHRIDSPQRVAIQSRIGSREPVHASAVGKALIAYLPEEEVAAILARRGLPRRTPRTITDAEAFMAHLAVVREQGYAIDDEEGEQGIRCIGAPLLDHGGHPVASVSISGPAFRTPVEKLVSWSPLLLEGTREISRQLGYRFKQAQGAR